jgi:prolipoprotein diacylglyceryl transferase
MGTVLAVQLAYIPSPSQGVWHLGPIPVRAYALCIIVGIVVAVWVGERRWVARGGQPGTVMDVAIWAVIFGLIGGRLYHVLSDPELYFGAGRHPVDALKVWKGGLGIWGAISLGGVGAWIGCRRAGVALPPFADSVAPGIALAQAIGRWGNYFNQELFGKPTTLPWGVKIDPGHEGTVAGAAAYHPTFLYESLWDLGVAGLLVWADRRFTLGRGRVFALYAMAYTAGRLWIETLRVDHANTILGLRLNIWTSIVVFLGALAYFILRRGPRETDIQPLVVTGESGADAESEEAAAGEADSGDAEAGDAESADAEVGKGEKTETADADARDAEDADADADAGDAEAEDAEAVETGKAADAEPRDAEAADAEADKAEDAASAGETVKVGKAEAGVAAGDATPAGDDAAKDAAGSGGSPARRRLRRTLRP